MRLPGNIRILGIAFGLIAGLSACSGGGGGGDLAPNADYYAVDRAAPTPVGAINGPQADYPQVLGEPYVVDGQTYTPADVLSYDAVGYATIDDAAGPGITISHKTLPLPSYVELTSLDTGRTILARAERRGPMTSSRILGLSPGAAQELGAGEGAQIRVRRVNPPEYERAALRSGQPAGSRLDTPDTLLAVLRKQLPATGSVSLARADARSTSARTGSATDTDYRTVEREFDTTFAEVDPGPSSAVADAFEEYETLPPAPAPAAQTRYALAPIGETPTGAGRPAPVEVARMETPRPAPAPRATPPPARATPAPPVTRSVPARTTQSAARRGRYVIQIASFSSKNNAIEAADKLGGFVVQSGRFYRVRTGPFATRGEADAALASARRVGYRDAFIDTSE